MESSQKQSRASGEVHLITQGLEYTIIKFQEAKGPDLREAMAISESRQEKMLTIRDAMAIIADPESKAKFTEALGHGVSWSYIYKSQWLSFAASIGNDAYSKELRILDHTDYGRYKSPILILKRPADVSKLQGNLFSKTMRLE